MKAFFISIRALHLLNSEPQCLLTSFPHKEIQLIQVPPAACWARGSSHGWKRSWGGRRSVNRSNPVPPLRQQQSDLCRPRIFHRRRAHTAQGIRLMARPREHRPLRSPLRSWPLRLRLRHRPHIFIMNLPRWVFWFFAIFFWHECTYVCGIFCIGIYK